MLVSDLDMEAFCAWLVAHEYEVVGQLGMIFQSPLARWLSERVGYVIGVDGAVYGRASHEVWTWKLLPRWASYFNACGEAWFAREVTGGEAFLVLARVEQGW